MESLLLVLVVVPVSVAPVVVDAPVEQTTSVGMSVTPPRAQIDLATLRVAGKLLVCGSGPGTGAAFVAGCWRLLDGWIGCW